MKLLLVEDNPADARLIREMLQEAPPGTFKLEQVDRLDAAQHRLREETFDAVLLDLGLPDSQGLATLQQALLTKDEFPFVVLTGFDDQATALEAMRAGAEDYLIKSRVNSELLIRTLHHAVERFRVREALRESEARFRRLAENAQDIIYRYRFQPTRGFDYVSPAATAITGYTPEEHYANPDLGLEIIHPDDRVLIDQNLRGEGRYKEPLVLRWVRKDGAVIWVEQINVPIRDAAGNLAALEGIARDITERKRMEQIMRASEQLLELFFSQSLDGFFFMLLDEPVTWNDTVDKEKVLDYVFVHQRLTKANDTFVAQYGAASEQLIGRTPSDFYTDNLP